VTSISDTAKKALLNKLIAKNIEARRLEEGLRRCQQMKKLFKDEGGAYYASAFIYNLQKRYPEAINELKQEISISGDKNLELIVAVTKRKAQLNKTPIQ
jgi:tetratricopeptide (TPR) repeat protein